MEIRTARLLLRPFVAADAPDVFDYLRLPQVHCFACMQVATLAEAEAAVAERVGDPYYLAIVLQETGRVIGELFAEPEATAPEQSDRDTFSPCWMLHPRYQRRGYMREAVEAYYDYLFTSAGARRVYTYTEIDNIACQRLCESLGMRREGEFREFVTFVRDEHGDPIYETTLQYAILKKEWLARRGQ